MTPAHAPTARACRAGSRTTLVIVARPAGMIIAAPTPIAARQATSASTWLLDAAPSEAAANVASPSTSIRLRPWRSARLPQTSISPPKTRA
jgi:hypothetical protein